MLQVNGHASLPHPIGNSATQALLPLHRAVPQGVLPRLGQAIDQDRLQ